MEKLVFEIDWAKVTIDFLEKSKWLLTVGCDISIKILTFTKIYGSMLIDWLLGLAGGL